MYLSDSGVPFALLSFALIDCLVTETMLLMNGRTEPCSTADWTRENIFVAIGFYVALPQAVKDNVISLGLRVADGPFAIARGLWCCAVTEMSVARNVDERQLRVLNALNRFCKCLCTPER